MIEIDDVRFVGMLANAGMLPGLGNFIIKKIADDKSQVINGALSTITFSAMWAGLTFAITRNIKLH